MNSKTKSECCRMPWCCLVMIMKKTGGYNIIL